MDDTQLAFRIGDEELGGASVLEMFLGRFALASRYAAGIKTKSVARDRGCVADQLDVDESDLNTDRGLLLEIFATAAGDSQSSGFGANGGRAENSGVGGVECLE